METYRGYFTLFSTGPRAHLVDMNMDEPEGPSRHFLAMFLDIVGKDSQRYSDVFFQFERKPLLHN